MRNKKVLFKKVVIVLISVSLFSSCDHSYIDALEDGNIREYTYSPVFAIPLVNSSLAIDDIFDVDNFDAIIVDEEGLIWLVYKGRVLSLPANELFSFPNQTFSFSEQFTPGKTDFIQTFDHTINFDFNNDEVLESIKFLHGLFNASVDAPELQANGYTLSSSFELLNSTNQAGDQPISGSIALENPTSFNLAGSTINVEYPDNYFTIRHTVTVSGEGNPANAPYNISFNHSITNIRYDLITGYLGQIAFPLGSASIGISIFDNFDFDDAFFEAPRVEVFAFNSYGSPIDLVFTDFYASNSKGQSVNLSGPGFENPWRIDGAETPGQEILTEALLDRNNSNMDEISAVNPNEFIYSVYGITNPAGPGLNFLKHDSSLNIDVEVFLPFWGRLNQLEFEEILENPLDSLPDEIEWLELNINLTNGFPLDAILQIYLTDVDEVPFDSLFVNADQMNFIKAAVADPVTGLVTEDSFKNTKVMIDQGKIESFQNASNILVKTNLMTYNKDIGSSVKILDSYRMNMQLGVRLKAKVIVDFEDQGE
jgi:hypothetical protein